jgi:hypothetical protein
MTELERQIAERRKDTAFMDRIRRSVRENKPVLDLLAAGPRPAARFSRPA